MSEGFERKNINELLKSFVQAMRRALEERGIDCDSELIDVTITGSTLKFSIPHANKNTVADAIQYLARKPEFIDFKFDSTRDTDGHNFSVEYAPGQQVPHYEMPNFLLSEQLEDAPEQVRHVFAAFTTQLTEEQFPWQFIKSGQPGQVLISVAHSAFTYETFQKILTNVNQSGVIITFNDDRSIGFEILRN